MVDEEQRCTTVSTKFVFVGYYIINNPKDAMTRKEEEEERDIKRRI